MAKVVQSLRAWGRRHSYSFFSSLGALFHHKVGTLMTVLVLGIAILLPVGLYVTLKNLDHIDLHQDQWGAITVFLHNDIGSTEATRLANEIDGLGMVAEVSTVTPEEGMAEFQEASGFGRALEALDDNPLPWVILVTPDIDGALSSRTTIPRLLQTLNRYPEVAEAQYDLKWLQRFSRLLELGGAIVSVLIALFSLAVIVVVANTIRLDVASRAEEIEVLALVGAGNGFIRQPFLYAGFWYGVLGSALALGLLYVAMIYLTGPLSQLMDAYGSDFEVQGLPYSHAGLLLLGGGILGLLGAWISVQRHLRALKIGNRSGRL